jgi:acyl carrier protein
VSQNVAEETTPLRTAIRQIVVQELEIEPSELTDGGDFEADYEADSIALLAVVARLEREVGVIVPSDQVARMTSLGAVFELVDEITRAPGV